MMYSTELAHPNRNFAIIEDTRRAIEKSLAPRKVIYRQVTLEELDRLVENGQANIVIAGAGFYRRHLRNGLRDIGTIVSPMEPDPNYAVGSVLVVRADRNDIRSLDDMKGKTISATAPLGFQGLLMLKNEIAVAGGDPDSFFKRIKYVGMDLLSSFDMVRSGEADGAVITSCLIETAKMEGNDLLAGLKIVGEKEQNHIACRVSTDLYPNWSLLLTPTLDVPTTRKLLETIHSMPPSANGVQWTMASDFSGVDSMFKRLKLGPYEHLRAWTMGRVIREYGPWICLTLFLVVLLICHSVLISYLVRKRTHLLQTAMEKQREQSEIIASLTARYENVRRAATVSQVSSIIAHELSQPIGGILLYAQGLTGLLKKEESEKNVDMSTAVETLGKIEARARKVNTIVDSVRNYAKNRRQSQTRLDLKNVLRSAKQDFYLANGITEDLIGIDAPSGSCEIVGNEFELKLAFVNLFRNSWQVICGQKKRKIRVRLITSENGSLIEISDTGPKIADELLIALRDPVVSVKNEGLGLGLSIARSIMESHFGRLGFSRSTEGGLLVTLRFPAPAERPEC